MEDNVAGKWAFAAIVDRAEEGDRYPGEAVVRRRVQAGDCLELSESEQEKRLRLANAEEVERASDHDQLILMMSE